MENSFQTSFIPKKPIVANGASSSLVDKKTTSITMVVSVSIFVVICLSAVGLYFYKEYLLKNIETLSSNLSKVEESFNKDTIAELELYDSRVSTVKQVLGGHIVLSPLFESINEVTLSTVQFTSFSHETKDNVFSVRMSGIARDYRSIALQADVFNSEKGSKFKDVVFSNLTKNKNNYVTFDIDFTVDPTLLSYANNITNSQSTAETTTRTNPETDLNNPDQLLQEAGNTQ